MTRRGSRWAGEQSSGGPGGACGPQSWGDGPQGMSLSMQVENIHELKHSDHGGALAWRTEGSRDPEAEESDPPPKSSGTGGIGQTNGSGRVRS
jgi:hypothetical protein